MLDPQPHHQRGICFDCFESFKHELKRSGLKRGWLLQITPASSDAQHEVCTQFPLTQKEQKIASFKLLEALTVSDEEAVEEQTRGQSTSEQWYASPAGRITASNFGHVCNSTWFKHGNIAQVQSLLKDLISPTRFSNPCFYIFC